MAYVEERHVAKFLKNLRKSKRRGGEDQTTLGGESGLGERNATVQHTQESFWAAFHRFCGFYQNGKSRLQQSVFGGFFEREEPQGVFRTEYLGLVDFVG